MGVIKVISPPEEDNNLPYIEMESNDGVNLEDFDLDSMGGGFDGRNI